MSDPGSRYPNRNRSPKHQPHRRLPECWVQASLPNLTARNGEAEGANGAKRVGDRKKMSHRTRATDQENRGYQHIRMHQKITLWKGHNFPIFLWYFLFVTLWARLSLKPRRPDLRRALPILKGRQQGPKSIPKHPLPTSTPKGSTDRDRGPS